MPLRFSDAPLTTIVATLEEHLRRAPPGAILAFEALDPDRSPSLYSGEKTKDGIYRSWQAWMTLAEGLGCALCTPHPSDDGFVTVRFRVLDEEQSWHAAARPSGDPEKYGADTEYARIHRAEEPDFLLTLRHAVRWIKPNAGAQILCIGVNQGDELAILQTTMEPTRARFVGIDHSRSAIATAKRRFPRASFLVADLRAPLAVGRFDLILAINVLHSPTLDGQALFRQLLRDHLAEGGGMILGFPNSRYHGHRLRPGAQPRHVAFPEASVVMRGVAYYRRTLTRKGFDVIVTGRNTLMVTAKPTGIK